ncbi:MAG TPA: hypothetical protein VM325_13130 [Alphaproteobacteria bacterium]|nr:hypothetical protein [Alphaproteobacteria bacterium]
MHSDETRQEGQGRQSTAAPPERSIFHFYGYDPRGSRFYDRLLRGNIETQSGALKPFPATTIRRQSTPQFTKFQVTTQRGNAETSVTVSIMRWERFVAETMIRNNTRMVLDGYAVVLRALVQGVCLNLFRASWKFAGILAALFLIPLGLSLAAAGVFFYAVPDLPAYLHVVGCLAIMALMPLAYWTFMMTRMYPRFFLWGMSFYSSVGGLSRRLDAHLPEFDAILDQAAAAIAGEMERHPEREFLLIGHSAGAILAIEVAGRLIERYGKARLAKRLRLVTLGGAWAFLAAHNGPRAIKHRAYVASLLSTPLIEWADVVAWEDVLSVPDSMNRMGRILRQDPPQFHKFWFLSPQYPLILSHWYLRRHTLNFVVMHFQYLLTPHLPGRYNYLNFIYNPWGKTASVFVRPAD